MAHVDIQCLLHTVCNLKCKFCYENKINGNREGGIGINLDYIKQLPSEVTKVMVPVMNDLGIKTILIDIMGGELFSDNIPDNIFDHYMKFAYDLKDMLKEHISDVKCEFYSISNGVFTYHERVEKFLRDLNSNLILSYDPVDRFSSLDEKEMWYDTFQYFKNKPEFNLNVSTILTKNNINAYIAGDGTFEKTGVSSFVQNNIYIPRIDYKDHLPSDDDLFRYYKWTLDNGKFNVLDINLILSSRVNKVYTPLCDKKHDYIFAEYFNKKYQRGHIYDCVEESPLGKEYFYGKYADQIVDDIDCLKCKQPIGLQKRGCLMCEYHSECGKMCWKQILFDKYEMYECPIQRVYRYLEDNPHILDNFKTWRDQYEKD